MLGGAVDPAIESWVSPGSSHSMLGNRGVGCLQQEMPRIVHLNIFGTEKEQALGVRLGFWVCW